MIFFGLDLLVAGQSDFSIAWLKLYGVEIVIRWFKEMMCRQVKVTDTVTDPEPPERIPLMASSLSTEVKEESAEMPAENNEVEQRNDEAEEKTEVEQSDDHGEERSTNQVKEVDQDEDKVTMMYNCLLGWFNQKHFIHLKSKKVEVMRERMWHNNA